MAININHQTNDISATSGSLTIDGAAVGGGGKVGVGTLSPSEKLHVDGNFKVTGSVIEEVFTITDEASVNLSPTNGTIQKWTLTASRTPVAPTDWLEGAAMTLMIEDGTSYAITWTTMAPVWVGGTAPTLATTGWTVLTFWKVGTVIYGAITGNVA